MEADPRFVQITSCCNNVDDEPVYLYALDDHGFVWYYSYDDKEWKKLRGQMQSG